MKRNKINSRGQMEIMGLVIIIILFSLGLLFAIRYVVLKPQSAVKQSFEQIQLSSNTLNAFLKTTSRCSGADMTELLRDCAASFHQIDCDNDDDTLSDTGIQYIDSLGDSVSSTLSDSCYAVYKALDEIFKKTFDLWKTKFYFKAYMLLDDPLWWPVRGDTSNTPQGSQLINCCRCHEDTEGKPALFTLPTDEGDLTVELKVCG